MVYPRISEKAFITLGKTSKITQILYFLYYSLLIRILLKKYSLKLAKLAVLLECI